MSVYAYLDPKIEQDEKFHSQTFTGSHGPITYQYLGDWQLGRLDGKRALYLSSVNGEVPPALTEYVTGFSVVDYIPGTPARENGVYDHKSATAEVETECTNAKNRTFKTKITIYTQKLEDARELLQLIRTGDIRPTKSYEGKQGGLSRQELEAQLAEANSRIEQLQLSQSDIDDLRRLRKWEGEVNAELRREHRVRIAILHIVDLLRQKSWPFSNSGKVANDLDEALRID